MNYYILKQFYPGAEIWVLQLNDEDNIYEYNTLEEANIYEYNTLEEAEIALPEVQLLYPDNVCKVSNIV